MKTNLSGLDRGFLFSSVLGSAASYSAVYLFHLILALKIVESITSPIAGEWQKIRSVLRWDLRFFYVFSAWYAVSFLWADDKVYAVRYCAYITLAALTVFYTVHISRSKSRLDDAFRLIFVVVSIELFLSALEGAGIIRLPFSPFSQYYSYFGREAKDLSGFSVQAIEYVFSMPTGFFGNPNNLAAFLALFMPFFVLHRRRLVKLAGSIATIYVVYMCGGRAAFLACGVVIFVCMFVWGGFSGRVAAVAAGLASAMLGTGLIYVMSGSSNFRVSEVGGIGLAVSDFFEALFGEQQFSQGGSSSARAVLIRNGLYALRESRGLGVGAGGSQTIQEQSVFQFGDLTSMHNFWVEILVEGGVLFAFIFLAWYCAFLWRLFKIGRHSPDERVRYYSRALFAGFLGFVLGAVGPSSVIYMLPMWMMVGVGLAVIRVENLQRERDRLGWVADQRRAQGLKVAETGSFWQSFPQ